METIKIGKRLERNIMLTRVDAEFRNIEKAMVADALYGIEMAKSSLEDEVTISEKLDTAKEVVMSYLFHIDLFTEE